MVSLACKTNMVMKFKVIYNVIPLKEMTSRSKKWTMMFCKLYNFRVLCAPSKRETQKQCPFCTSHRPTAPLETSDLQLRGPCGLSVKALVANKSCSPHFTVISTIKPFISSDPRVFQPSKIISTAG
jgi:hypothetical protein